MSACRRFFLCLAISLSPPTTSLLLHVCLHVCNHEVGSGGQTSSKIFLSTWLQYSSCRCSLPGFQDIPIRRIVRKVVACPSFHEAPLRMIFAAVFKIEGRVNHELTMLTFGGACDVCWGVCEFLALCSLDVGSCCASRGFDLQVLVFFRADRGLGSDSSNLLHGAEMLWNLLLPFCVFLT